MNPTVDILRGELERHFDLDSMKNLSADLLGLDPDHIGGTAAKGAFARALVDRCVREDSLEALADAILLSAKGVDDRVKLVFRGFAGEELKIGSELGGYRVTKKIGEGGLGVVYLGERSVEGKSTRVALKVVRQDYARDRASVRRFLTVSRMLRTVRPEGLAPVVAVGQLEDGRPWVATEFVDGQTLASRIQRTGAMHLNEAKSIFRGVLRALGALHARGLVHGDVKSENVFVVRVGAADGKTEPTGVLVDGGTDRLLARGPVSVDRTGAFPIFGTAKSIAPEQARGAALDARSDLYSFGSMLYETIAGRPPFSGASPIDVIAQHLTQPAAPPSQFAPRGWVLPKLDEIILRALSKDASERYQTANELLDALESVGRASQFPPRIATGTLDETAFASAVHALKQAPTSDELQVALERVVEPAGAWQKAAEVFKEVADGIEVADGDQGKALLEAKKALYYRIARIHETDLDDAAGAEAVYERILELDPSDEVAEAGIEELRRASGNAEGLIQVLLQKAEREATAAGRAGIFREIAELYEEKLSQPENAFVAWVQAMSEEPRDTRAPRAIERLADSSEKWTEALTTLGEAAQHADDPSDKVHLFTLLGRWYAERLHRPDFALPCYSQALAIDPANEAALDGTTDLYRRAQSWPDLVTMLLRRAEAVTIASRARDHRAEAGEIVHRKLNDGARAAEIFQAILRDDPAHPRATAALEVIYEERKDFTALASLLEAKSHGETGERKVATLVRLGEVAEDHLDDATQAAIHYEAALMHDDTSVDALKGLERVYARAGRYKELLQNLERQTEVAATPRQRIGLFERMGSILEEEFVDAERAAETFEKIVAIDGAHDAANTALARLYRKLHRFDDLVETLERHARSATDEGRKLDLLLQAVRALMVDVGAPERALSVAERVLTIKGDHSEALELVARLKAGTGDTNAAISAVDKLAEAERDAGKRAELWVRAGRLCEERGDKDRAIDRYKRALDADSASSSAAAALRAIYADRGDAHGAVELLLREIEITSGATAKAKLHAQLGTLVLERMHDAPRATDAFKKALELDGTCTEALRGLGELAAGSGDHEAAARYFEPLLARTGDMPADVARDIAMRCGDAFRVLKQHDKAQRAYLNAKAFAPTDRDVLERLADTAFESGASDEAAELYKDLLVKIGSELLPGDRGSLLYRLGESERLAGDAKAAEKHLDEAAKLRPEDRAPLMALAKLHEAAARWDLVIATLQRRIEHADLDEKFELLVQVGDVLADKRKDKAGATKSYVAALEIKADDRNLLTKLMAVYSESKDWSRLVEVILRIADLVGEAKHAARYFVTAASIMHHELKRHEEAAQYYDIALDGDATLAKAFEGLVECLAQKGDFARLERVYRRQLERAGESLAPGARAQLWDALGTVLLERLNRPTDAAEAFERAQELDTEDRARLEKLATIYAADPKTFAEKATATHAALLHANPYRLESYQALRRIYTDLKRPDEAWCVCQALRCLGMAEPDEDAFFKKHRTKTAAQAKERFSEEIWAHHVVHPSQDALLTAIFSALQPSAIATRSQPLAAFGVDASQRRNAESDPAAIAQTLYYAAGVTQIALPDVYYRESDPGGLSFVFGERPSVGIGKGALAGGPAKALAFVAGRQIAYYRSGHYLRQLVPTGSGLRAWLLAAIRTSVPQFPVPNELAAAVDEHTRAFKQHLPVPQQDQLRSHVTKLLAAAPELDLKRWVAAVDLTADRVGFVLSNDLEIALALIKASPEDSSAVPQKERLRELQLYAVSDEYLSLRRRLGVSIA